MIIAIENIDPYYVPHAEIMIMTGMITSEMAGFRRVDIIDGEMVIQNSIVMGHEKQNLKTKYRNRRLPITAALQKRLDIVLARSESEHLFTMRDGSPFNDLFRKTIWKRALKQSDVTYRPPYSMRHSHIAWALNIGADENRLVYLAGHSSKQMIYEIYGSYVPGLENDKEKIREYYGEDFK